MLGRALLTLICLATVGGAGAAVPTPQQVRAMYVPSDAWLLDRSGQPLQQLRMEPKIRRLEWTTLGELSPAFRRALLESEDKRFYEHEGVDWAATLSAMFGNLWSKRARGASTITMQLAGLLDPALMPRGGRRTVPQKWDQIGAARDLEKSWRKDDILESYVNLVTFRGELQGVAAMSWALFEKYPGGLDQTESAVAAVLLRGPNAKPEVVAQRACVLLTQQQVPERCAEARALAYARLAAPVTARLRWTAAPHLARQLLKRPGDRVISTLDGELQRYARDTLNRHLGVLAERHVEDGALIVLDNRSGDVLAYVGSSGPLSEAAQVDGVIAPRQAGSTLKPFLYELAIEQRWLTAASLLEDTPLALTTGTGLYVPQNYEQDFKGAVSVRNALGSSLNVPAVRTLVLVGPERFRDRLRALGLNTLTESGEFYGHALALGGADVSLQELTNAYRTLANHGRNGNVRTLAGGPSLAERRVLDPGASFIISDILADRSARALTFGLENSLATRFWTAVKTGTSKDMRDNWCIGYSERYTVGVWVGNFSGAPMWDVSGVTGAAPVWRDIMSWLHSRRPSRAPTPPSSVVKTAVSFVDVPLEVARDEWFLAGTEMTEIRAAGPGPSRISYPTTGTVIALDPDIPNDRQRVFFDMQPPQVNATWRLNDQPWSETEGWLPTPGKHHLQLFDPRGRELDRVEFEVRGATIKP